jgi:hypothetical protein
MRNIYISQTVQSEQDLYENIIIESMQIYGQEVQYIPRTLVNEDRIFGEDVVSRFDRAYQIEMYLENLDGFDGDQELFTKFGVEIRDRATLHVSRRRWNREVGQHVDYDRPQEGDLIYLTLSNQIFEIMRVIDDRPFYQMSDLPTYRMEVELFEFSDEDFDTSVEIVDDVEVLGAATILNLSPGAGVDFQIGETIRQVYSSGKIVEAEIVDWNADSDKLSVTHISTPDGLFREFTTGTILGLSSNITRTVASVGDNLLQQDNAQNDDFENFADDILDFSEGNPFGEPS